MENIFLSVILMIVCTLVFSIIIWFILGLLIVVIRRRKPNSLKIFGISVLISATLFVGLPFGLPKLISSGILQNAYGVLSVGSQPIRSAVLADGNFSLSDAIDRVSGGIVGVLMPILVIVLLKGRRKWIK